MKRRGGRDYTRRYIRNVYTSIVPQVYDIYVYRAKCAFVFAMKKYQTICNMGQLMDIMMRLINFM